MTNEKKSMHDQSAIESSDLMKEYMKYFTPPEGDAEPIFKQASMLDESGAIFTSDSTEYKGSLHA